MPEPASFLVDSNVLIYVLDARTAVVRLLRRIADQEECERPFVSALTVYEVLAGAAPAEQERTVELLAAFEIIPVTESIAVRAAILAQSQRGQGRKAAIADTIIAATALTCGKTLVTYNQRDFARLSVDLYQDLPLLD